MKTIMYLFCLSVLFVSCQESTAPTESVNAKIESSQLVISNTTNNEVFYAVFEKNSLSLIDWIATCRDNNLIKSNTSKSIAITDSTFLPSNEAVIYWWHKGKKLENSEIYGPDELRTITLTTK